jgi:hypothetical protein
VKCIRWYIRYLQNLIEKRATPASDEVFAGESRVRIRMLRGTADLKEMRLATLRSQMVAVQDVDAITADPVRTTTAEIMAIAPRLAPQLVVETSRIMIQAKLEKACKESLRRLARSENCGGKTGTSSGE